MKRYLTSAILLAVAAYLALWPVPVEPEAWNAPTNNGYVGPFKQNTQLQSLSFIGLDGDYGPEDAAVGPDGLAYVPTHSGKILNINLDDGTTSTFSEPGGRVLGIEFAATGELYAADAYRGLLHITSNGTANVLTNATTDGSPILYANDLDVSKSGSIYFSDSSTKFGAAANGGTLPASLLDLVEHAPHGRVLRYQLASKETTIILDRLSFANGIALSADDSFILIAETGSYRVLKHWLSGTRAGETETLLDNLPGFPDNINGNPDGTFWMGLVSPRSPVVDALSNYPMLRKVVMRLPAAVRPKPQRYGLLMRFDSNGTILDVLQDPGGDYALITGGIDVSDGRVVVTSLTEPRLGILKRR